MIYITCISNDDAILWNGSEEDWKVISEYEEDDGTNSEWRQWHWLVMADWIWHALCIKCVKLIVKYFFLEDFLFLRDHLRFVYIHFLLAELIYLGRGWDLRIESSCVWVNMVYYYTLHNIVFSNFIPTACEWYHA